MTDLTGVSLVQGRASGPVLVIRPRVGARSRDSASGNAREEIATARRAAALELRRRSEMLPNGPAREIVSAHAVLIDDPVLTSEIAVHVDAGRTAEEALAGAASTLAGRFEALGSPLMRERAADMRDVCECIAQHLAGTADAPVYPHARVICAAEISAADVLRLEDARPLAFVLETGAATSHAAILIRALGVPAVIGVRGATAVLRDGERVLVDGDAGRVVIDSGDVATPDAAVRALSPDADPHPARTSDGLTIAIAATIAGVADLRRAIAAGADGVGLFRTEWLFLRGEGLPSEDEQLEIYRQVAALVEGRPITIRAVDLGGDKHPAALRAAATPNPALGLRGIRLLLAYPELLRTQVRALLRAFAGQRFRLLLPMVNDPGDITRVRALLQGTTQEAGMRIEEAFDLGVMVETPAAALMADDLAAVVDFLSIGTNDLTQYVLAADREGSADAYQPLHPAVLRLVRYATEAAVRRGKPVATCGERAADPLAIPLWIAFGITGLSVSPEAIARSKRLVRSISAASVRAGVEELLALPTAAALTARLREWELLGAANDVRAAREAG
ncbi:MAG TPA: phosphoenolpyruvate--protein phosphotransferase [Vicinamibacterales bacterium]|nr:phosphoenolpyruvate--protein phosphotransferase [Vicinamibacterales bacterium]